MFFSLFMIEYIWWRKMEHYFTNNKNLKENINEINAKVKDTEFVFYTDNGVFNKKGLDYGTRVLLENID